MATKKEGNKIDKLREKSVKATEIITGVLLSDKKDFVRSGGQLVQSMLRGDLREQLFNEISQLKEKGCVTRNADSNKFAFADLLSLIDQGETDNERFNVIKKLFLFSITTENQKDQELAHQLMQICKKLSAGEILVLRATFNIFQDKIKSETRKALSDNYNENSRNDWLKIISIEIGHNIPELIENHEESLIRLRLLTAPTHSDNSGVYPDNFRLTKLAITLCQFLEQADIQLSGN